MAFSTIAKSLKALFKTDASLVIIILFLILVGSSSSLMRGNQLRDYPCEEIYVVREGETLHTISDKCSDPYIVEQNPQIHDSDDVFPGLVIKITPYKHTKGNLQELEYRQCTVTVILFHKTNMNANATANAIANTELKALDTQNKFRLMSIPFNCVHTVKPQSEN
ncbi:Peptidoglycan-binding LysM domain-containing family protein [Forsythia ovata]|uniref:Peptidoglycan-binding LysM domain-containing family protein n=1 Tax=Forsythia ovata TaxID=205694 RepID=A0ABD1X205_9LAMI